MSNLGVDYPVGPVCDVSGGNGVEGIVFLATYEFEIGVSDDSLIADGSMTILVNDVETAVNFEEDSGAATVLVGAGNNGLALSGNGVWWISLDDMPTLLSNFTRVWVIIEYNSFNQAGSQRVGLLDSTVGIGSYARMNMSPAAMVCDTNSGAPSYSASGGVNSIAAATYAAMERTLLRFGPGLRVNVDGWDTGGVETPPTPMDISANEGPNWCHVGETFNPDRLYLNADSGTGLEIGRVHFYVPESEVP